MNVSDQVVIITVIVCVVVGFLIIGLYYVVWHK